MHCNITQRYFTWLLLYFSGELQVLSDVLSYTSHNDPQLRGNAALVIGRLMRAVLGEGRGSWDSWMATLHPTMTSCRLSDAYCVMIIFINVFSA